MARYLAALLGGGANEHGSVLEPATLATVFEPHYQPDPRIPGMGLAFSRGTLGGHRFVEHEGILPGFSSQIFLAPDDGIGVMAFTNGARRAMLWLPGQVAGLLKLLLGVQAEEIRTDVPQHPEVWSEICGWYQLHARLTDPRLRAMAGAGIEVFVRGGQLRLRILSPLPVLYRGFPLLADDDKDAHAFRIDLTEFGIGTGRVLFSPKEGTGTTALHFDLLPVSLWMQPATTNPRLWVTGALAAAGTALALRRYNSRPRAGMG
jgi:hypothetical protein